MQEGSAYAVTHEVFYLTDFGKKTDTIPGDVAAYISLWIPVWIEIFGEQGNFDLAGELLLSLLYLRCYDEIGPGVSAMLDAQSADGSTPGPIGAGRALARILRVLSHNPGCVHVILGNYGTLCGDQSQVNRIPAQALESSKTPCAVAS